MPYITQEQREPLDAVIQRLSEMIDDEGELNYTITCLLHLEVKKLGKNYATLNKVQGVMDCASREFYRKVVAPYEDQKIKINGDVDVL